MGCNCGKARGAAGRAGAGVTLGFYVILPDKTLMPRGVNPEDPSAGEPPYFFYTEAHSEVVLNGGGTVRRLRRDPVTA